MSIITASNVSRQFRLPRETVFGPRPIIRAVIDVSIEIEAGETMGLVGESGSGKTTLSHLLMGLDAPTSGTITYNGIVDRSDMSIVFQDPNGSLDPRMKVERLVSEPLRALKVDGDHKAAVAEMIEAVGLPSGSIDRYPHELSGGQRQRVAIARSLIARPKVLIADEPVSALDVSVRAKILNLLQDMKERFDLTMVMVSHDLSVMNHVCDRIAVMYNGQIVELGESKALFENPQNEYTRTLLAANPRLRSAPADN